MSDVATAIDWMALAHKTPSVIELLKAPNNEHKLRRVVCVPKKSFPKLWPLAWGDLELAASRTEQGCELRLIVGSDIAPPEHAYMREGKASDGSLVGKSLLFSQGWTK